MSNYDLSLFNKECKFVLGCRSIKQVPLFNTPEIAFWGRSNVGKSSFINTLVHRTKLVKVSKKPGKTKEINFFNLVGKLIIADLPGYGFAKVAKEVKEDWQNVVIDYICNRPDLKRIYIMIDARHGLKAIDIEIMKFLNSVPKSYAIVLTKVDKVNATEKNNIYNQIESELKSFVAAYPNPFLSSSKLKFGFDEVKENIITLIKQ